MLKGALEMESRAVIIEGKVSSELTVVRMLLGKLILENERDLGEWSSSRRVLTRLTTSCLRNLP